MMVFFSKIVDFCTNTHFVLHFFPLLAHCVRGKGAYLFGVFFVKFLKQLPTYIFLRSSQRKVISKNQNEMKFMN